MESTSFQRPPSQLIARNFQGWEFEKIKNNNGKELVLCVVERIEGVACASYKELISSYALINEVKYKWSFAKESGKGVLDKLKIEVKRLKFKDAQGFAENNFAVHKEGEGTIWVVFGKNAAVNFQAQRKFQLGSALLFGAGCVLTAATGFAAATSIVPGLIAGAVLGAGSSALGCSYSSPVDFDAKDTVKQTVIGGAVSIFTGALQSTKFFADTGKLIASGPGKLAVKTAKSAATGLLGHSANQGLNGKLPTIKGAAVAVAASGAGAIATKGAGTLVKTALTQGKVDDVVAKTLALAVTKGTASAAASQATTNYIEGKPLREDMKLTIVTSSASAAAGGIAKLEAAILKDDIRHGTKELTELNEKKETILIERSQQTAQEWRVKIEDYIDRGYSFFINGQWERSPSKERALNTPALVEKYLNHIAHTDSPLVIKKHGKKKEISDDYHVFKRESGIDEINAKIKFMEGAVENRKDWLKDCINQPLAGMPLQKKVCIPLGNSSSSSLDSRNDSSSSSSESAGPSHVDVDVECEEKLHRANHEVDLFEIREKITGINHEIAQSTSLANSTKALIEQLKKEVEDKQMELSRVLKLAHMDADLKNTEQELFAIIQQKLAKQRAENLICQNVIKTCEENIADKDAQLATIDSRLTLIEKKLATSRTRIRKQKLEEKKNVLLKHRQALQKQRDSYEAARMQAHLKLYGHVLPFGSK